MVPRSKSDAEEDTIISVEIVATNLRKQIKSLDEHIKNLREQRVKPIEEDDGGGEGKP